LIAILIANLKQTWSIQHLFAGSGGERKIVWQLLL